jgi:hypothetical protein
MQQGVNLLEFNCLVDIGAGLKINNLAKTPLWQKLQKVKDRKSDGLNVDKRILGG